MEKHEELQLDSELQKLTEKYEGSYSLFYENEMSRYEITGVPGEEIKELLKTKHGYICEEDAETHIFTIIF